MNRPFITATIAITFHDTEQATKGGHHSITIEEQATKGAGHTSAKPAMIQKSSHSARMQQTGKETDQDQRDDEDMDPYRYFIEEEQLAQ